MMMNISYHQGNNKKDKKKGGGTKQVITYNVPTPPGQKKGVSPRQSGRVIALWVQDHDSVVPNYLELWILGAIHDSV